MNIQQEVKKTISLERHKIDKLMLILLLAHLPFTLFLAPWGYDTYGFAITASILVAVLVVIGFIVSRGTIWFGVIVGIALMLNSAILIQAQLGRIEMHFHIFVALAFLLAYRDSLPIIVAAAVGATHHIALTYLQLNAVTLGDMPIMLFNYGCSWDITFLHAFFVVVEAGVLIYLAERMRKEFLVNATVAQSLNSVAQTNNYKLLLDDKTPKDPTISALQNLMHNTDSALAEIITVMTQIEKGDFSARVQRDYQGDLAKIQQSVNAAGQTLNFTMDNLNKVMDGLAQGDFSVRMDQQVERQAREKVDKAMDTMSSALNDVAQMASAMQQGDFSVRLADDKPGLLGQVSQNLNQSMVQVQTAFEAISTAAKALAEGDLTQHIDSPMDGELDELKQSINEAIAELNQLISTLAHTSQSIEQDADRVQTNSSIVAQSSQNQVQSLAQTALAVQHMRTSVEQNNQATHQVNNLAREADEISKLGVESMQKLDQSMNKVNESSKQIANIVSLIDSIAFQTNLLALNAAVEAARAGEAGRGFAVVASEVRGLAQKSAEASKDIRHLIDQTVSRVADSIGLVEHASETFNRIQHKITDVAHLMGGVASSSQQQYQGALQIHQLVENMDQDTRQMTDKVEDSAQSAEVMAEQSTQLNQMVRRFKVKNHGQTHLTLTHRT